MGSSGQTPKIRPGLYIGQYTVHAGLCHPAWTVEPYVPSVPSKHHTHKLAARLGLRNWRRRVRQMHCESWSLDCLPPHKQDWAWQNS